MKVLIRCVCFSFGLMVFSCQSTTDPATPDDEVIVKPTPSQVEFKNRSITPSFVKLFPEFQQVEIYTLISSEDTIAQSRSMIYGGAPDGQGFIKNPTGEGYILVTNHENAWSISRLYLNSKLDIIKGDYVLNTEGGMFRLCSGTMATPEVHGFGPIFLSTGETYVNAMTHAIDPVAAATPANQSRVKPALGKFSGENSVPLTKLAYPGKTVIILGEDDPNGQVYLYVSNTLGDLDQGTLHALRRVDQNQIEISMKWNETYDVEFVEVPNAKILMGEEIESLNKSLKSIQFGRVEDLDFRKGSPSHNREIYFTSTGGRLGSEKTYMGRVYQLVLDPNTPLKGKLKIIADGDVSPSGENWKGRDITSPDNLCVTENYVYIQEDGDSFLPEATHNSLIWQYHIASGTKKPFLDMRHLDQGFVGSKYNPISDRHDRKGIWEYGAMVDISSEIGVPGTFTLNIHSHSWVEGDRFANPSRSSSVPTYKAGGQTLLLKNVPR
ncbi:MAG: alkaline phosphatase PhoX [Spirosomataceae bacterium]